MLRAALVLGLAQSLVVAPPKRRATAILRAEPPEPADRLVPFDIQRRVEEAKRRQTEDGLKRTQDLVQQRRLRRKELLKALHLAELRRRFSAFGFDDVDRELKRLADARRSQDSFDDAREGNTLAGWLGPLAESLLPPPSIDAPPTMSQTRPGAPYRLDRPPVAKGLKFPKERAHPPPAPAPPVGATGLRPVPATSVGANGLRPVPAKPRPPLPKPSVPLPSVRSRTVVQAPSEVYSALTDRATTGGMQRGLQRDASVSSLYTGNDGTADDAEPPKLGGRVNAALGRYASAPRRWFRRRRERGAYRLEG